MNPNDVKGEYTAPVEGSGRTHQQGRPSRFASEPPGQHVETLSESQKQEEENDHDQTPDPRITTSSSTRGGSLDFQTANTGGTGATAIPRDRSAANNLFATNGAIATTTNANLNRYAGSNFLLAFGGGGADPRSTLDALALLRAGQQPGGLAAAAQQIQNLQFSGSSIDHPGYHASLPYAAAPSSSWLAQHLAMEALRQRSGGGGIFPSSTTIGLHPPSSIEEFYRAAAAAQGIPTDRTSGFPQIQNAASGVRNPALDALTSGAMGRKQEELEDEDFPSFNVPSDIQLPPIEEGNTPHFKDRTYVPLAIDEDSLWLSERQCFIRAEILEVVRASKQEVQMRSSSKTITLRQVGIRCRFCAHVHPSGRAIRASAYPSSIKQMYQSFTMMVRDHFGNCASMPEDIKKKFLDYQEHKVPSSSLSREYWAWAAERLGMVNTDKGITITEETQAEARKMLPFGTDEKYIEEAKSALVEPLVKDFDKGKISDFLYLLMSLCQKCYLVESELVGKRKDAIAGLPGLGCRLCCKRGRLGFCRVFPLNKRSLPTKVNDMYNHMMRCPLTSRSTKVLLRQRKREADYQSTTYQFSERDRSFIDKLWSRLGCKGKGKAETAEEVKDEE